MAERLRSELDSLVKSGEGNYPSRVLNDLYGQLEHGKTPPIEIQLRIKDPQTNKIIMSNPDKELNRHMPSQKIDPKSHDTLSRHLSESLKIFGITIPQDHSTNPAEIVYVDESFKLVYEVEAHENEVSHPDYVWVELVAA